MIPGKCWCGMSYKDREELLAHGAFYEKEPYINLDGVFRMIHVGETIRPEVLNAVMDRLNRMKPPDTVGM